MANLTSLESNAGNGLPFFTPEAGTALGYRQAQLDSKTSGMGHWLSSPFARLPDGLTEEEALSALSIPAAPGCVPPRGPVCLACHRAPQKAECRLSPSGGSSVPRLAVSTLCWPQVSTLAGPRALPSATLLTQGPAAARVVRLGTGARGGPSRPLTAHHCREGIQTGRSWSERRGRSSHSA